MCSAQLQQCNSTIRHFTEFLVMVFFNWYCNSKIKNLAGMSNPWSSGQEYLWIQPKTKLLICLKRFIIIFNGNLIAQCLSVKFIEENSASQCHRDIHYPHRQLETSNLMENVSSNLCFLHFDNFAFLFSFCSFFKHKVRIYEIFLYNLHMICYKFIS